MPRMRFELRNPAAGFADFGSHTDRSDALLATLDACYASPGPRGADTENPRISYELEQSGRRSRNSHDICIDYAA